MSVTCVRSVVFSTNKADRHDITEILPKEALNTMTLTLLYTNTSLLFNLHLNIFLSVRNILSPYLPKIYLHGYFGSFTTTVIFHAALLWGTIIKILVLHFCWILGCSLLYQQHFTSHVWKVETWYIKSTWKMKKKSRVKLIINISMTTTKMATHNYLLCVCQIIIHNV